MGIKNIHLFLIACSALLGTFLGIWALNNNYPLIGYLSLISAAGLAVYGIQFAQKAKSL